ncbi:N-acetylmuramoyl-L-alanine amidase [Dictyobacter alpinus]|uniref:N-acetylmuramoyl-L-alanine amidase n=1 Tax=Dictyobacter alpinus TaxID=2014873 RepID=UPI0013874DDC|nr:N-acetylmuramoyl-L-alanine amidase [Dictyobacter alpinus]
MPSVHAMSPINQIFEQAFSEFDVPVPILKAVCYLEGGLSNHNGIASADNGYGCMHLTENAEHTTLAQAAQDLNVDKAVLKTDLATNIRGGAAVLRDYKRLLSGSASVSSGLDSWSTVLGAYSGASAPDVEQMYADAVYKIIQEGFVATAEAGDRVTLSPQAVQPRPMHLTQIEHKYAGSQPLVQPFQEEALPGGCKRNGQTDYPGAINCIVNAKTFECSKVPDKAPCTYESAKRPEKYSLPFVAIHDIEGPAISALKIMHNVKSEVSVHYIVDSNGTVYQVVHETDIAYHLGNYWYNQHSIGIEHSGYAATGYRWYNATQYLASAKLTAYLLKKYHIPLDRSHVIGHGDVPAPMLSVAPNHVDPGPYWLWGYYFKLINAAGVPYPNKWARATNIITISPPSDRFLTGLNGRETSDNHNFFSVYSGPSTRSALAAPPGDHTGTDEVNNVGTGISYAYTNFTFDKAGTGYGMYQIWYGLETHLRDRKSSHLATARQVWLAVPPDSLNNGGNGIVVALNDDSKVYSKPDSDKKYQLGDAPDGATFVAGLKVQGEDDDWYEINYNHRQAWIPASNVDV